MKIYKTVLFLLFAGKLTNICAMDFLPDLVPFRHDQELSNSSITSITQDTSGQMWLSTSKHLYSFDGYQVNKITLPSHPAITTLLEIQCVYSDRENKIWLGLSNGICRYDQDNKIFQYYFPEPEDMLNMSNIIYQIVENPEGTLFFATRNGIFSFDKSSNHLKRIEAFPWHKVCSGYRKEERITSALHVTYNHILWGGTEGDGLWYINLKDGNKLHFRHEDQVTGSLGGNIIHTIFEDRFGVIWIGTENGLSSFIKETSSFSNIQIHPSQPVLSICETEESNLLLGTPDGFYCYNRKNRKANKIDLTSYPSLTHSSNYISVLHKDRSGGIWIGTRKGLVRYYAPHDFLLFKHNEYNDNGLAADPVYLLTADPQASGVWIGHEKEFIDFYQPSTKVIKHYRLPAGDYQIPLTGYITHNNDFLIGTKGGLVRYNRIRDCFEPWNFTYCEQTFANTYAILQDRRGRYWFGVLDMGIYQVDPKEKNCKRIPISYEKSHKNIYTNTKIIYEDRQGYIWIVFWRAGIMRYNPDTGEEKLFTHENTGGMLPNNTIWSVKEDPRGRIIMATAGGVAIWDTAQKQFTDTALVAPLSGESIVGMERMDSDSTWWLSTTKGIIRITPWDGKILHYTEADGLQDNVFHYQAIAKLDSSLFFGGNYGLNIITPHTTFKNNYIPHPYITYITLNGREIDPDVLPKKNDLPYLSLKKGDKAEIFFSSFSFCKEWRNRYRYCFTGDTPHSWSQPIAQNKVVFMPDCQGSTYFHLTASNSEGLWSQPRSLLLIETRNPWLSLSLIAGLVFFAGLGMIYFRRNIHRRMKAKRIKQIRKTPKPQTDSQILQLQEKFKLLMEEEQLWKNKRFSKTELGSRLKLNEQQLTLFLKNSYGKSFPELINHYRVEAVKRKMEDPQNKDYTLFALGEECGFNSRSSFYRVFKECTGIPPAEYQERLTMNAKR